jgi:hypothetical protein
VPIESTFSGGKRDERELLIKQVAFERAFKSTVFWWWGRTKASDADARWSVNTHVITPLEWVSKVLAFDDVRAAVP